MTKPRDITIRARKTDLGYIWTATDEMYSYTAVGKTLNEVQGLLTKYYVENQIVLFEDITKDWH